MSPMGEGHGYQHLWTEAVGASKGQNAWITWFNNDRFYTATSFVSSSDQLIFGRLGANDPNFNLRRDPCFIIRKPAQKDALFVSAIEPHGQYNTVTEIPIQPFRSIERIEVLVDSPNYTVLKIINQNGKYFDFMIANQNADPEAKHEINLNNTNYQWTSPVGISHN